MNAQQANVSPYIKALLFAIVVLVLNIYPINNGISHHKEPVGSYASVGNSSFVRTNALYPEQDFLEPTIQIAVLIRNKEHTLPYFFGYIEQLNYPKSRLSIFIRLDHSSDNSSSLVKEWVGAVENQYHHIDYQVIDDGMGFPDETDLVQWSEARYTHVIKLRQEALNAARDSWADFLLMIDADVMLVNRDTLHILTSRAKTVVAPMLNSTTSGAYGNFWGAMTEAGYYKRSSDYFSVRARHTQGVLPVPMVHTIFLVNMKHRSALQLAYDPPPANCNCPKDDIIIFARSAQSAGIQFYLDNTEFFGYFPTPTESGGLVRDKEVFLHLKLQANLDQESNFTLTQSTHLNVTLPEKTKLGFDEIYVINLVRRTERRARMQYSLDQLGIEVKFVEAVDGTQISQTHLDELGIVQLEGYSDPYHKRGIKKGEIGCFLSHWNIWQEVLDKGYQQVVVLEDDIRFSPGFLRQLDDVLREAKLHRPDWDLLYLGRKRMVTNESLVEGSQLLVYPGYTYWTLGYVLRASGAQKLVSQKPFPKLVPVDEYLPIMFDKHPREEWLHNFSPRDLIAISAEPLLIEPTHYTGEPNYTSDTEDSVIADVNQPKY